MSDLILQFTDVSVVYANGFCAVRNANLSLKKGETLAIVGESGGGKTTLARAALGVLPKGASISGSIKILETEIVGASERDLRRLRGKVAGFVAQEPFSSFNPLFSVYDHLAEARRVHNFKPEVDEIFQSLDAFGIENAAENARRYPFEWSGGMLQRASIAAASAFKPALIVADEPTSALDRDRADRVLEALRTTSAAILFVSHDINIVRRFADKIAVCFQGQIVETGDAEEIFACPQHEYTKFLLAAAAQNAETATNKNLESATILEAKNLSKTYGRGSSEVKAVTKANLIIKAGEIVGISGASGSGKSTLLRLLATIETPTNGEVYLENELATTGASAKILCKKARQGFVIPIYQDAVSSLDKNWAIWRIVTEPLDARHRKERVSKAEKREIAQRILAEVGLSEVNLDEKPPRLSVGQCQRVAIARALAASPKLIAADEPTAALDASHAQSVMTLFRKIARDHDTAVVIVSHNEPLLKSFCHHILQMRGGVLSN